MEAHDSEKHSDPVSLRDTAEFQELARLLAKMPPDRRAEAFAELRDSPELKIFNDNAREETNSTLPEVPPDSSAGID